MKTTMNGQQLTGKIRTLGTMYDNNCITIGTIDDTEIRMNVEELNKVLTLLDFDIEKSKKYGYATINENCLDSIYASVER